MGDIARNKYKILPIPNDTSQKTNHFTYIHVLTCNQSFEFILAPCTSIKYENCVYNSLSHISKFHFMLQTEFKQIKKKSSYLKDMATYTQFAGRITVE